MVIIIFSILILIVLFIDCINLIIDIIRSFVLFCEANSFDLILFAIFLKEIKHKMKNMDTVFACFWLEEEYFKH